MCECVGNSKWFETLVLLLSIIQSMSRHANEILEVNNNDVIYLDKVLILTCGDPVDYFVQCLSITFQMEIEN